jgi:hypothetical protein
MKRLESFETLIIIIMNNYTYFIRKKSVNWLHFFFVINTLPCISLVEHVVSKDFDWPPIIGNTSIQIVNPFTFLMVELNVPLH